MQLNSDNSDSPVTGRDIVIVGLQPWYYEIGSNCKTIATHLARDNRVLYVNLPVNRKTFLSRTKTPGIRQHCEIIKGNGEKLRPISDNMWEFYPTTLVESINGLPSNKAFSFINYFNNRRFARDIEKAIDLLGFKDIILFNDNDIYNGFHLKEFLRPKLYIYYCRDFLQGYDYWKKHVSILEPKLIRKADIAVANSLFYAEYCSSHNPQSYYIGQGCNFDLFNTDIPHSRPPELDGLSYPIIGYVGAIDSARLDPQIVETIATTRPDWNIVLVGPEDAIFQSSTLHQLPNVHFTGRKPLASLPDFVAYFDACINPQLVNIITKGNYPLKIDEYLAMGKPVIATRTDTMKLFEDHTWLADGPGDYPALIETALAHNSVEEQNRRIAFARSHTWENCIKELYKVISKQLS
ncbi:MAG TPA: glycosyltransferase [Puia sp.]|jgi:glycosyltransferase involved in cell wall biosynthesis